MTTAAEAFMLALQCHEAGRLQLAVEHYRQAIHLDPGHAPAHNNLGNALFSLGDRQSAQFYYRQALRLRPDYAQAHSNLGNVLRLEGKMEEAAAHCQRALQIRPELFEALTNLGIVYYELGKLDASIQCFENALRINPRSAETHCNLGNTQRRQRKLDEAISSFRQAIQLKPDYAEAFNNAGCAQLRQGELDQAIASFQGALQTQPDYFAAKSNLMSCTNYDPRADPNMIFAEHCRFGKLYEQPAIQPHMNGPAPERRLRIGYISPDFRYHALMRYLEPVLEHHDQNQVEVFCYAEVVAPDAVTERLKKIVPGWCSICRMTDIEVAQRIRHDGIDILVDLAGHTANNRLGALAHKPAPIQCTWLGYMNTTGMSAVDYRLTDDVLDPPGQPKCDTEELLRLPFGMCCFAPPDDAPAVTPLPALERGYLTFGSLSKLFKLNGLVFDLWIRVLKALPSARLLLFHETLIGSPRERIRREFAERGIADERVILRQGTSEAGYLRVYDEIDCTLDTFPCTGGVTTCESLWMGVPVISLCGERPVSRNSAALLARVGLSEWAVETSDDYVNLAASLVDRLHNIALLRAGLRERMRNTICDAERFTRSLEEAYRTMWRLWCARH